MRIMCLSLMIVVFLMSKAENVYEDSISIETSPNAHDMFMKSLPDSIYESPMVTKWFYKSQRLSNVVVNLVEHTDLNGNNKSYYLQFKILGFPKREVAISMTTEEVQSIIQNLKEIYENTRKLRLSDDNETISYKKLVSSRSLFAVILNYNSKKDRWDCQINVSIIDPTNYVGKSVVIYQDIDYKAYCRLDNYEKEMPILIDMLERGLEGISERRNNYFEPKLVVERKNDGFAQYYIDNGDNLFNHFEKVETNVNYSAELFNEEIHTELNHKINGIVNNKYKDLKKLGQYGIIDVVVDRLGTVLVARISINEEINKTLDEKMLVEILSKIKKYRFKSFDDEDYPNIEYIKVKVSLKGNPRYRKLK